MNKYFVSYVCFAKKLFSTDLAIGNAFFESDLPMGEDVVRAFEEKTRQEDRCKKCVVLSIQLLETEAQNERS